MNIYLANNSKQSLGGGFTFLRNFEKYAIRAGANIVDGFQKADVVLISGATMVDRKDVELWKKEGKKVVLRIDNIPRNSRNRNTGTSRLYDFAQLADLVVYQSFWAKDYIMPFVKKDGPVIINGADTDFYHPDGPKTPSDGSPQFLYLQYNRDETKQWHQAWYKFILESRNKTNGIPHLWIVGNFSPENVAAKFDFFNGEKFDYKGVMSNPADIAEVMRGANVLLMPYFNDACSNTLVEFINCHSDKDFIAVWKMMPITIKPEDIVIWENGTGGNAEIIQAARNNPKLLTAKKMVEIYLQEIDKLLK